MSHFLRNWDMLFGANNKINSNNCLKDRRLILKVFFLFFIALWLECTLLIIHSKHKLEPILLSKPLIRKRKAAAYCKSTSVPAPFNQKPLGLLFKSFPLSLPPAPAVWHVKICPVSVWEDWATGVSGGTEYFYFLERMLCLLPKVTDLQFDSLPRAETLSVQQMTFSNTEPAVEMRSIFSYLGDENVPDPLLWPAKTSSLTGNYITTTL